VFDGKPPPEKEREIQTRKETKVGAAAQAESIQTFLKSKEAGDMDAASIEILELTLQRCQNQSWHMTRETRQAFQKQLWDFGIPYVKSLSEADDVLIDLSSAGKLDVILSTDMDYLLGGVPKLWIPSKKGVFHFEELKAVDILEGEALTQQGLMDAGLLCGTEERQGAKGVPCRVAFVWMSHYGSLEGLLKSNVTDTTIRSMFPSVDAIAAARETVSPKPAFSRMRPDHYERVKDFLSSL
jgi:5'-3' exonuclease